MSTTIKSRFRSFAGQNTEHICKECKHCVRVQCGQHAHYKCRKIGITGSSATDIRLRDFSCMFFESEG